MTAKKNMSDNELDKLLSCFDVPDLNEAEFDSRLMACICNPAKMSSDNRTSPHRLFWMRRFKVASVAVAAFLAVIVFSNIYMKDQPLSAGEAIIASINISDLKEERYDLARAASSPPEAFLAEMADQDFMLMDYAPTELSTEITPPPIDAFLDELLGVESRPFKD